MNPILKDFQSKFYTERLLVRMPMPGDGKVVYDAIEASLEELKPWMPFAHFNQTEEDVEANIREAHLKFLKREDLRMLVFHKETGEFIASTGLHRINWEVPKFEIGYWIDTRHSGKGYMTETVQGLTDFAFDVLSARRVEIRCDALNKRSAAIPEKLGYKLDAILKNDDVAVSGKELRDTCIYSKTK